MTRIANPLVQPLSKAFDTVARVLIGMPSVEERQMRASQAELMQAQREKAVNDTELGRRQLGAIDGLAGAFGNALRVPQGPTPGGAPIDPTPHLQSVMPEVVRNAAALNPNGLNQIGSLLRAFYANAPGATQQLISNAMLGAGDSMQSTPVGFGQAQAQDMKKHGMSLGTQVRIADMTSQRAAATQQAIAERQMLAQQAALDKEGVPVQLEDGRQVLMPKSRYFEAGTVNPQGPTVSGAPLPPGFDQTRLPTMARTGAQGSPFSYRDPTGKIGMTVDGMRDLQTGQPLAPGSVRISVGSQDNLEGLTKTQNMDLTRNDLGLERFSNTLSTLRQLGADPTNVGTAGAVRNLVQNSIASVDSVAAVFGTNPGALRSAIGSLGVSTDFRDTIPQLQAMGQLAAYQAAEALAQQTGKGLSDKDAQRFMNMLGDPASWLGNQQAFFARIDQMQKQVEFEIGQAQQLRARMQPQGTQRGAAPPAAAPAQAPIATGVERWERGADGRLQRVVQ